VFLHLGSISPLKGQQLFVDAFLSAGLDVNVYAVIAGDAAEPQGVAYRDALVEKVRNHSTENVRIVGWQDDPYAALGAADVLVHTSIEPDSLPTVILEAMAMAMCKAW
jgi:glycosyltransferase involved in cell wall biosynthesis